jgi:hypothetical protein
MLNGMYEIDLYVTNATGLLQRVKILPPEKYYILPTQGGILNCFH